MRIIPGLRAGVSLGEALRRMSEAFRLAGIEEAQADARILLGQVLHLERAQLIAQDERILEPREINALSALAARRLKREPIARILGRKEFWSLPLAITRDVLVPRPETETVVELALDVIGTLKLEKLHLLDIGTGSGALLLALLSELPNAVGAATDLSTAALQVARANAERLGLADRSTFVVCDVAAGVAGRFDLIVSNPPYIARGDITTLAPEVCEYDPLLALDGGPDGLSAYRAIAAEAPHLLAPGGQLIVELGAGQEPSVRRLFTNAGLNVGNARNDLAGIPRALAAAAS